MTAAAGGTISVLVGAVLLRLSVSGVYTRYVRAGLGPWLVVAGIVAVVLGTITIARALRHEPAVDGHGHSEAGMSRAGWLLLAPIAALLLVAPPPLGSFGVDRGAAVDVRTGAPVFDPLPGDGTAVPMTLLEYGQRAFEENGASLGDATVELTGFVADIEQDGFLLARYQIACCAADAAPIVVRIVGVHGGLPARDTWVTVTGRFEPTDDDLPVIVAASLDPIPIPDDPYE